MHKLAATVSFLALTGLAHASGVPGEMLFITHMDRTQLYAIATNRVMLGMSGGLVSIYMIKNDPPGADADVVVFSDEIDCGAGKIRGRKMVAERVGMKAKVISLNHVLWMTPEPDTPAEAALDYVCKNKMDSIGGSPAAPATAVVKFYYESYLGEQLPKRFSQN